MKKIRLAFFAICAFLCSCSNWSEKEIEEKDQAKKQLKDDSLRVHFVSSHEELLQALREIKNLKK